MTHSEWEAQKTELERELRKAAFDSPEEMELRQELRALLMREPELEADVAMTEPPETEPSRTIHTKRDYFEQMRDVYTGDVHVHHAPETLLSRPSILHKLPQPDYGKFIGREQELAKIKRILRPYPHSQHSVVTIDGIGGIGKSALALEIAHYYLRQHDQLPPEERFEAIIWTSAKQTVLTADGIRPRRQVLHTLQDIYRAIAVALQREDITRAGTEEQDAVVTRALTLQRTLLLVDNLETVDDEAVLDFLQELPAPTKAIVTTRHRIDVAYPLRLTGMPWKDGRNLIVQECEEKAVSLNDDTMRQLYERTDGVPLALVWSLAQMGFGYSPQAVLRRLGQPTNDITQFCFAGAIERIRQKPAYTLLLVMSLCAKSASRETLGYVTELPELDRDDGLVMLEKLSLVNKKGERFWLLPLTKIYAAAEFEYYSKQGHLREKWVEYFTTFNTAYTSEHFNWTRPDWLLAEGENILSIIHRAIAAGQGEVALLLARSVMRYLDIQGRWNELIDYGEKLYTVAELLNAKRILAWICAHWLSFFYVEQGNIKRAKKLSRQSFELYKDLGDTKGMCLALNYWGRIQRRSGKEDKARATYHQAMELAERHGYGDGVAYVHFELGKLARDDEDWEAARRHFYQAKNWCEGAENPANLDISFVMATIGNLGWVEYKLGHAKQGREFLGRTVKYFEQKGGKGNVATLYWRLAMIEQSENNDSEAIKHAQKAFSLAERFGMERELREAQRLLDELTRASANSHHQEKTE